VKTIPFLLCVVNRHTWVQAIQTSFLSNLKCSNHQNCTCKSMRNRHSGGCETKRAQNSLAISTPCLCERACVIGPSLWTLFIIQSESSQYNTHKPSTLCPRSNLHIKKHYKCISKNPCTQALTCISNEVTLCCKNVGGAMAVVCAV